jgi:hypothetical protein
MRKQVRHSNVRSSKPRRPGEIRPNPILCLQTGHIGRSATPAELGITCSLNSTTIPLKMRGFAERLVNLHLPVRGGALKAIACRHIGAVELFLSPVVPAACTQLHLQCDSIFRSPNRSFRNGLPASRLVCRAALQTRGFTVPIFQAPMFAGRGVLTLPRKRQWKIPPKSKSSTVPINYGSRPENPKAGIRNSITRRKRS